MASRKILVLGSGGREHALALRLLASPSVREVIVVPGNAGTARPPASLSEKVLRNAQIPERFKVTLVGSVDDAVAMLPERREPVPEPQTPPPATPRSAEG